MKKYDWIWDFKEGLAVVKLNNKWGFVNKDGEEVIPLIYDDVLNFTEGLAQVRLNGKWEVINKKGELI